MKTGSLYLGFHTSKKCVYRSQRANFFGTYPRFTQYVPFAPNCGLVRRVSAAAHEAYDFQMVFIGQLLFRELRARNDGAVLLDSHTLRIVTQLLQQ